MRKELIKGFEGFPGVYESLVVQRNKAWADNISDLLQEEDDYLVIVGALHLVGKDSVISLLARRGHDPKQL